MRNTVVSSMLLGLAAAVPAVQLVAAPFSNATLGIASDRPPRGSVKISGERNSPTDGFSSDVKPAATNGGTQPEVDGSGCKAGTTHTTISQDGATMTVLFDNFIAQIGGTTVSADHRKFCQITVNIDIPDGYTFAVQNIRWQGYTHLDKGVSGIFHSKYSYDDVKRAASMTKDVKGPITMNDLIYDDKTGKGVYMPCTGTPHKSFIINTAVSMHYGTRDHSGSGLISVDSVDAAVKQTFELDWQKCRGR